MFKRIFNLLLPFVVITAIYLFSHYTGYECVFRRYLHVHCAGCGLTRSIHALMHLNIKDCFYYNILTFPIIGMVIFYIVLAIKDLIKKENKLFDTYFAFIVKYLWLFAILIIVSILYENICNI